VNLILNTELENELYQACQILFGAEVDLSRDFLFYIQSSGIKSAYRKKALLTHPDRSIHLPGNTMEVSTDLFVKTNQAYEKLIEFIKKRDNGRIISLRPDWKKKPSGPAPGPKGSGSQQENTRQPGTYYRGPVPKRKLFFGQFLFYSGAIPWEALIKAILWQRNQRPKIGDIAKSWGWLNERDIELAFRSRNLAEPIGSAAVRLNLLNEIQVKMLLIRQQKLQKPFGEYFTLNYYLSRARLINLLQEFKKHNMIIQQNAAGPRRTP